MYVYSNSVHLLYSCPETNEECLRLAVSFVKIIYWLLIVVTRLLKLCIEVCRLQKCTLHMLHVATCLYKDKVRFSKNKSECNSSNINNVPYRCSLKENQISVIWPQHIPSQIQDC